MLMMQNQGKSRRWTRIQMGLDWSCERMMPFPILNNINCYLINVAWNVDQPWRGIESESEREMTKEDEEEKMKHFPSIICLCFNNICCLWLIHVLCMCVCVCVYHQTSVGLSRCFCVCFLSLSLSIDRKRQRTHNHGSPQLWAVKRPIYLHKRLTDSRKREKKTFD